MKDILEKYIITDFYSLSRPAIVPHISILKVNTNKLNCHIVWTCQYQLQHIPFF